MITPERSANRVIDGPGGIHPAGIVLAVAAGAWHLFLMTAATNDNFVHLTFARQWLAGDWPVRDFFDHGWFLQYALSAAAEIAGGHRLMSEAVIVAAAWAISTGLVFQIVRRLTGSLGAAILAALLPIVAGARGYSYPKGIVYAVAAWLWWEYVRAPSRARVVTFGAWAAIAFLWRPDHGIYVALALVLAVVAAHGIRPVTLVHSSLAGAMMLALVAPYLLYVQLTVGLPGYVRTGAIAARVEHTTQGPHAWPLVRLAGGILVAEPADRYAPTIGLRWTAGSFDDDRRRVLARYGLTVLSSEGDSVRVRLSERSIPEVRALMGEPIVEDTAGIERSSGTLASWSAWQRLRFRYSSLRVQVLPSLDAQARASEFTVALFYALPIVLACAAPWMSARLPAVATPGRLAAFALFALLVDLAMLRSPFRARAPDAVVLSAIVFGCCVAWMWRAVPAPGSLRALVRAAAIALVLAASASVGGAGEFADRLGGLAAQATSWQRAGDVAGSIYRELMASPPLQAYVDRPARFSLRLAAYVRECVPPSDRLLVLWFEPEIYYFSDRLMAHRHLGFAPAWASLSHEQRMSIDKVERFSPPIVLARRSALEDQARASYPGVVGYVERQYQLASTVLDGGEEYLIFARRDRPAARTFGPDNWPCFTSEASQWARVGKAL
ncbi:MAG TPA: hypothetical protein VFO58_18235 [Vicinamibacterales bacterium]|nr:hypothetical protein [Vicinamibacterales bacterium]